MQDIIDYYASSIMGESIEINTDNVVCEEHLFAIIHDEYFNGNNHSRIVNRNKCMIMKEIKGKMWIYLPTIYDYKYDKKDKHYEEIIKMYKNVWLNMESIYRSNPSIEFVIDCRSLKTRGEDLLTIFSPFINDDPVNILETNLNIQKINMGNYPPFISIHEKVRYEKMILANANIVFIVDKSFASVKDTYFTCLIANLSKRYKIYGNMGNYIGYIFNQYVIKEPVNNTNETITIRIPDTKVEISEIFDHIPDIYKPYLIKK